ncbi:MAG: hypothetical protein R6X05_17540 [Desulfobacterales bacterium]
MNRLPAAPPLALAGLLLTAALLWLPTAAVRADALFINDYRMTELMLGDKETEQTVAYASAGKFLEKKTRFTGSWMKRFFGEVKEEKVASYFFLDRAEIREIDWQNGRIFVFPFEKMIDSRWIQDKQAKSAEVREFLEDRYRTIPATLDIAVADALETVDGYPCRRITAELVYGTDDLKKKSRSVTAIRQELWLSEAVPGYADVVTFHEALAQRMGIEAERLGNLSDLLKYWDGPLEPLHDKLRQATGYPVKSTMSVDAHYTTGVDTAAPKTITKRLKTETVTLREVRLDPVDVTRFADPPQFQIFMSE